MRDEKNWRARYQWFERRQFVVDLQLKDKLALVTGSTAGIGLAIGSTLAGEGATVIINGRSESRVTGAVANIRQKYPQAKLEMLAGDLSEAEMVKQATSRFPQADILLITSAST